MAGKGIMADLGLGAGMARPCRSGRHHEGLVVGVERLEGSSLEERVKWVVQTRGVHSSGLVIGDTLGETRRRFGGEDLGCVLRYADESGNVLDALFEGDRAYAFALHLDDGEPPYSDPHRFPRFELAGISLGMTASEIEALLGKPRDTYPFESQVNWVCPGLTLHLSTFEGVQRVSWVAQTGGEFPWGLRVGSEASEVREFLGGAWGLRNEPGDELVFWGANEGLHAVTLTSPSPRLPPARALPQKPPP